MTTENNTYDGLARMLVLNVGGRDNVVSLTYRGKDLAFVLRDDGNANSGIIESLDGIKAVSRSNGEYCISVDGDAPAIYSSVLKAGKMEELGLIKDEASSSDAPSGKLRLLIAPIVVVIVELLLNHVVGMDITTSCVIAVAAGIICGVGAVLLSNRSKASGEPASALGNDSARRPDHEILTAPVRGETIPLKDVSDDAFASEALGKGVAFIPSEGRLYAPCDGVIGTFFPTGHAIGIHSDKGAEILMHVGLGTVKLDGRGFTPHKKQGDHTRCGELLLEFDIDLIKAEGMSIETPMIISNTDDYKRLSVMVQGQVEEKMPVIEVFTDA